MRAQGTGMKWPLLFHRDLVPLPSILTAIPPIGSCYADCTARMTNAGLRLVNRQDV
jgi:hypothetical protein